MADIKISTVHFETLFNDKGANLATIGRLTAEAASQGANVVPLHDGSISGYTFARDLRLEELTSIAEPLPSGPSTQSPIQVAKQYKVAVLAERGRVAKHRKIHPFISKYLSPGDKYTTFELFGWKCGILICYDNNVLENVRATALLAAEIVFMPHVTMCTPSSRPGAGFVDAKLWETRHNDPTTLREEFDGLKGRKWLMKWLPARAYDNAVYSVFVNPIGIEGGQLKHGCSMILEPFGDIIAECRKLNEDIVIAICTREKLTQAGGWRYRQARRVELYGNILRGEHEGRHKVSWLRDGVGGK